MSKNTVLDFVRSFVNNDSVGNSSITLDRIAASALLTEVNFLVASVPPKEILKEVIKEVPVEVVKEVEVIKEVTVYDKAKKLSFIVYKSNTDFLIFANIDGFIELVDKDKRPDIYLNPPEHILVKDRFTITDQDKNNHSLYALPDGTFLEYFKNKFRMLTKLEVQRLVLTRGRIIYDAKTCKFTEYASRVAVTTPDNKTFNIQKTEYYLLFK